MADSTEQKLMARALVVLAAINGTGSYQTTLGTTGVPAAASIADSRPNWDQTELPAISVFQGMVEPEDRDDEAQKVLRKCPLIFRGFLEAGTTPENGRKLLSDIMRAMRTAGDKWIVSSVELAKYTEEGPHRLVYQEDSYELTGVELEINIFYEASHMDMDA